MLARSSFTSDSKVFSELDEIAGEACETYRKEHVIQFLKTKGWIIEELEEDVEPEV
jgi:hypothetical protein